MRLPQIAFPTTKEIRFGCECGYHTAEEREELRKRNAGRFAEDIEMWKKEGMTDIQREEEDFINVELVRSVTGRRIER